LLIAAIVFGATLMSFRQSSLEESILRDLYGQSIEVTAVMATDAHALAPRVMGDSVAEPSYSALIRVVAVNAGEQRYRLRSPARLISTDEGIRELLPGQKIRLRVSAIASKEGRVAALLIGKGEILTLSEASGWAQALDAIRDGLRKASGTGDSGALIPGMVLGDTSLRRRWHRSCC